MSTVVENGDNDQARTLSRAERRMEWWSKAKEFKSKLRDRSTLARKENEQQPVQAAVPKVDTSRGFRPSTVISRLSSAAPTSRMSSGAAGLAGRKTFDDTKKHLANSAKQKPKSPKGSPLSKGHNHVAKKKPKSASLKTSPTKSKELDKVAVIETILAKPEMAEISLNARGVELTNMANHINPRYIVFIGNLPYNINRGQLTSHFRKAGGVKSVRIPKDRAGNGKGFAYIEFKDRISHGIALRLHHTTLAGRKINVEFSKDDKKEKS